MAKQLMNKQLTSLQHPIVKHLVKLRQNCDYRYDHQAVIVEGVKPIKELVSKRPFKTLLVLDESLVPPGAKSKETYVVTEGILHKISGMQTSEGILAEVEMPANASLKGCKRLIVLDGINDPGNLGTILRTALALGWEGAFIIQDSCDPYNEKALRAARGATFRLPIAQGSWEDLKRLITVNRLNPVVADLDGVAPDELKKKKEGIVLILGNEAHGPSAEAKSLGQAVTIPMPGPMESLNVSVAGALLMYALTRKS